MVWDHPKKQNSSQNIPNFSVALGFFGIFWDSLGNAPKKLGSSKKIGITPRSSQKIWGRLGSSEARVITAFLLFKKGSFHLCDPVTLRSHGN